MIEPRYWKVLQKICTRLEDTGILWALTGSMNMAVQGMNIAMHDIDLQTDRAGAYQIESIFPEYVVEPVRYLASERMRSHLGKLMIDGIQVEIIGALQKLLHDQTWEATVEVGEHRCWVEVEGLRVPGLSLEYEYRAYRQMGRTEKAEMIRKWLAKGSEDSSS